MTDAIRYVCVSDLHLGDKDSILTRLVDGQHEVDPFRTGDVLEQLVVCLRQLIGPSGTRPTLILNGDIVEMAFGEIGQSLMVFERLVRLILTPGDELFDRLVYLPGNHDHHVWEIARETQYVQQLLATHHDEGLPGPQHVTPLSLEHAVPSFLLNQMIRHVRGSAATPGVDVMYPNLALRAAGGDRCVVIHHGHYVESLYHLFSNARSVLFPRGRRAETINQLEAENFAWIDFVWSLLGRSGDAGRDVETLFDMVQYPEQAEAFSNDLAARIALVRDIPFIPGDKLEYEVLRRAFLFVARKIAGERGQANEICTEQTMTGLRRYLLGPTLRQVQEELGAVPEDLAFVFGHTHKPFERQLAVTDRDRTIDIVNTGGWTVDSRDPAPPKGAAILVMNDALDLASIRIYNDTEPTTVEVELRSPGETATPFVASLAERIGALSGALRPEWEELGRRLTIEVAGRRAYHRERFGT